ncbi:periplasmic serine protease [Rhodopirellula maiorica SM1]|uniref:Periplasmic serine protease n=1 Tax=Rhodopirellula maiorica SM1 TaxID=1265738 RepID=M5R8I5_9BACT|nr:serine protease [Rhodopirellula maiorica]EMI15783.1 periplasmic serine protease [Rhodopirellula maiorica SM1]
MFQLLRRSICPFPFFLIAVIGVFFGFAEQGFAQLNRDNVANAKTATVLVERPSGAGFGTAFCINAKGFFITNQHVVQGESEKIPLIMNSGTEKEVKFLSEVVRTSAEHDLALLRAIKPPAGLVVLNLGDDATLFETQQITAFGFPFGTALALKDETYPRISVNVGRVVSLRKRADSLESIQIDAVVNPGNSGGPILDNNNMVVGVVVEKVIGTDVNFAIPISKVKTFLEIPDLTLEKINIRFVKRHQPVELKFNVVSFGTSAANYQFKLKLRNNKGESPEFEVQQRNDGDQFSVKVIPVNQTNERLRIPVEIDFASGKINGELNEQAIRFGNSTQYLAEMKSFERLAGDRWRLTRYDGRKVDLKGLLFAEPTIYFGGSEMKLDLASVTKIDVGKPNAMASELSYDATLLDGTKVVSRIKGVIPFRGAPGGIELKTVKTEEAAPTAANPETSDYVLPYEQATFEDDEVVYELDEPFDDYVMGGADRYMIFKFGKSKRIAIFDLLSANLVHEIKNVDSDALLTAGSKNLYVVLPSQMLMQRWSLETFELEKTTRLPTKNAPKLIQIGVNADEYLFLFDGNEAYIVDSQRLKPMSTGGEKLFYQRTNDFGRQVDAAANGNVFGTIMTGLGPVSYNWVRIDDGRISMGEFGSTSNRIRWAAPSPLGRMFHLPRGQIYNMFSRDISPDWLEGARTFPTVDPRYFIAVRFKESLAAAGSPVSTFARPRISELFIATYNSMSWRHTAIRTQPAIHLTR